ncbi:gluconokinase [Leptothrix sp. BB-4]
MNPSLVVMGVAGCGKSSLGEAVAVAQGLPMIEGDRHHSAESVAKMSRGIALTDDDRAGWLDRLAELLRQHPDGAVLTCSALKRAYRDRLRAAAPGLRFAWLDIPRHEALARVAGRGAAHFFSADLVDSQFAALEPPLGEPGVLRLDASRSLDHLQADVSAWLATFQETPAP